MIGVKNISYIITGLIVSMYFFPFGFTFLPEITNSKNLCGFMGVILALFDGLKVREIRVNKIMLGAIFIVIIYSIIGYISIDINNSFDKSYANYFVSFSIWTFGAYFACSVINKVHGVVNIRLVGIYLAAVGLSQCILALLNNTFPFFKVLVDTYIEQGSGFLDGIGRWYGIGAALDPAGVRFCLILILIAGIVVHDKIVRESKKTLIFLLISFFTIILIGNIISRTTSVGAILALLYIIVNGGLLRKIIPYEAIKFNFIFTGLILLTVLIAIYLFQTDQEFNENIRYGFEGFFNWAETGEWYTDSTDKLNREMWVWPDNSKAWIIGTGYFDNWIYGTDIGYCRLILYNGLVGFSIFSLLFVYNFVVFSYTFPAYNKIFFLLLCLTFIIWIKVSTDIYQIWAMLFAITFLNPNKNETNNYALERK